MSATGRKCETNSCNPTVYRRNPLSLCCVVSVVFLFLNQFSFKFYLYFSIFILKYLHFYAQLQSKNKSHQKESGQAVWCRRRRQISSCSRDEAAVWAPVLGSGSVGGNQCKVAAILVDVMIAALLPSYAKLA